MVGRQNTDIADTLQLRDVAMATTFRLSMGYNFNCMIASDTLFDTRGVGFRVQAIQSNEDIAKIEGLRDVATTTNFGTALAANGL